MATRSRNASRTYRIAQAMDTSHRRRFIFVMLVLVLTFVGVAARIIYLHCYLNKDVIANLLHRQHAIVPVASSRGTIYDRRMRTLARTVEVLSLHAVPSEIKHIDTVARELAPLLGVLPADIMGTLNTEKSFVWIARQLESSIARKVQDLELEGLYLTPEPRRFYPKGRLASHLLGITNIDGKGIEGIELCYDDTLRSEDGHIVVLRDPSGRSLLSMSDQRADPTGGNDLVLTIDENIQHAAQESLRAACTKYEPETGMAIVQNSQTGEVLAVANCPEFDPNSFTGTNYYKRRNAAFVDVFEPGSAFKIVTAAGALEEGLVEPYETIDCHNGSIVYCGDTIRDFHAIDTASFVEVIEQSSNIGTIEVAGRMGPELFNQYMSRFGFGKRVGTGFPGESRGILRPIEDWSLRSMGALPIGQEVAVTCLQLAQAFSAIANDGIMVRPRIVNRILAKDGTVAEKREIEILGRTCSPSVARITAEMLCGVVENGTGGKAAIEGYRVAGKTGTGQIAKPKGGGFYRNKHTAVFAGFVPANDPVLTIVVVLKAPHTPPRCDTGGYVCAPVFKEIALNSLRMLGIPPGPSEPTGRLAEMTAELAARTVENEQAEQSLPGRSEPARGTRNRTSLSVAAVDLDVSKDRRDGQRASIVGSKTIAVADLPDETYETAETRQ